MSELRQQPRLLVAEGLSTKTRRAGEVPALRVSRQIQERQLADIAAADSRNSVNATVLR